MSGGRRVIVNVSDMHVGHRAAIWPEKFETVEGQVIRASGAQKQLLEYWRDFWSRPEVKEADTVFMLGDLTEGRNRLEGGNGLMTPDIMEQARAATALLGEVLPGYVSIFSFVGSKYHAGDNWETDTAVVNALGGTDLGIIANLLINGTDRVANVAHVAGDAMIYKATAVDRDSLFMDAAEGTGKWDFHVDLYVRAHWHWYHLQENESRTLLVNPCWKFYHPIRRRGAKYYSKLQPSIGATVMQITRERVTVIPFLYPLVQVYDALREV